MKLKSAILLIGINLLFCTEYPNINPYDPDFIGDYRFNLVKTSTPEIIYVLKEYIVQYTTSKDTFVSIYPDTKLAANVDVSNFWNKSNNSIRLVALKEDTNKTSYNFVAETPNGKLFKDSANLQLINPFSIKELSRPEYKESYSCKIDVNTLLRGINYQQKKEVQSMLYDTTFQVAWHYQSKSCTLAIDSALSFVVVDSNYFSINAIVMDKYDNRTDTLKKLVEPVIVRPHVSSEDTIKYRIGTVPVPFCYSDSNDNIDSIFYQLQNKPVTAYKAFTDSVDTLQLTFPSPAETWLDIWVTDESKLKSAKKRIVIKTFIPDTVQPHIRIIVPSADIDTISTGSYLSQVVVTDNFGVKEVFFQTSLHKHPASQVNDTIWSGTITDIPAKEKFAVTVCAEDSFSNTVTDSFFLYRDLTLTDTIPPSISQESGPVNGSRVLTGSGTMTFKIEDASGIDSVYYTVDGVYKDTASLTATNIYTVNYSLSKFGNNVIKVFANDGSLNKNPATFQIVLNYNTRPGSISNISPVNEATGIDHTSGVTLSWSGGDDSDGDAVSYVVKYGSKTANLNTTSTLSKNVLLSGLTSNTKYYWYVEVTTSLDVIRCPAGADEYYSFTTKDISGPQITQKTGPIDGQYVLNNVVTMTFDVVDTNGLDSVYYELNGAYAGDAQFVTGNEYSITFTMTNYGSNQATIHAIDASTEHNKSQKSISVVYYSIPTSITVISPSDNATGIENIGGITFSWHPASDDDDDAISYNIHYGTIASSLQGELTTDTVIAIDNFDGFTQYIWYVDVITAHDTVRCPDGDDNFYTFKTKNHDAVITGFDDFSCSINDSIPVSVTASDPETIKEYQWDFNGDGSIDKSTNTSSVGYISPGTSNNYNFIFSVIDGKGGITLDTAVVSVTNNTPSVDNFPDTLVFGYNEFISLNVNALDDGKLIYTWDMGSLGIITTQNPDTTIAPISENLPLIETCKLLVTDDDNNQLVVNFTLLVKLDIEKQVVALDSYEYITFKDGELFAIHLNMLNFQRAIYTSDDFITLSLLGSIPIPQIASGMFYSKAEMFSLSNKFIINHHAYPNNYLHESNDGLNWNCIDTTTNIYEYFRCEEITENELLYIGGAFYNSSKFLYNNSIRYHHKSGGTWTIGNFLNDSIAGIGVPTCMSPDKIHLYVLQNDELIDINTSIAQIVRRDKLQLNENYQSAGLLYSDKVLYLATNSSLFKISLSDLKITKITDLAIETGSVMVLSLYKYNSDAYLLLNGYKKGLYIIKELF